MIIVLLGQEKNLGILTLTDHLLSKLGKQNTVVVGWNYLVSDYKSFLDKIIDHSKTKNVIVKYVLPKIKFSNQDIAYPKELKDISDVVFRVPTYLEEIAPTVPINFLKGDTASISGDIRSFYT